MGLRWLILMCFLLFGCGYAAVGASPGGGGVENRTPWASLSSGCGEGPGVAVIGARERAVGWDGEGAEVEVEVEVARGGARGIGRSLYTQSGAALETEARRRGALVEACREATARLAWEARDGEGE